MATPETKLKNAVIKVFHQFKNAGSPIFWMKISGSPMQLWGMPDFLVVLRGRAMFFELKAPGENPTPLQRVRMESLFRAGAWCFVVWTSDQAKRILEMVDRGMSERCVEVNHGELPM
jgi:hypothetical protein